MGAQRPNDEPHAPAEDSADGGGLLSYGHGLFRPTTSSRELPANPAPASKGPWTLPADWPWTLPADYAHELPVGLPRPRPGRWLPEADG